MADVDIAEVTNKMQVDRMKRVPVSEQEPKVRAKNFKEVCLGYNEERAIKEALRCLIVKILNV